MWGLTFITSTFVCFLFEPNLYAGVLWDRKEAGTGGETEDRNIFLYNFVRLKLKQKNV